eukprot:8976432-Pyramimonas_sp.AAC.1
MFPRQRPQGPRRESTRWQSVTELVLAQVDTQELRESFVHTMELEFVDIYQISSDEAHLYQGRARPLRRQRAAARKPSIMPYPRLSPFATWWRLVTQAFTELGKFQSASHRRATLSLCVKLAGQGAKFTDA